MSDPAVASLSFKSVQDTFPASTLAGTCGRFASTASATATSLPVSPKLRGTSAIVENATAMADAALATNPPWDIDVREMLAFNLNDAELVPLKLEAGRPRPECAKNNASYAT